MLSSKISHVEFTRADMHSSIRALNFIENLLGPLDYVVDRTLSNSISSAITRLEGEGYLKCDDGYCFLTNHGIERLKEIKDKYTKNDIEPIGINKYKVEASIEAEKAIEESQHLTEEQKKEILKNFQK